MFDLDAAVAGNAPEPFRFTWGAQEFALPRILQMPIDRQLAILTAIDGLNAKNVDTLQLVSVLNLLVGEDLLAELNAAKPMPATALMALLMAWIEFQGDDLGKSSASPASSARTAAPSKPTSRSGRGRKTN